MGFCHFSPSIGKSVDVEVIFSLGFRMFHAGRWTVTGYPLKWPFVVSLFKLILNFHHFLEEEMVLEMLTSNN